jgi:hypothetical protein
MLLGLYAIGLAYVITGDSVAARDPLRFWWALALWFVVAPIGWLNSAENRM